MKRVPLREFYDEFVLLGGLLLAYFLLAFVTTFELYSLWGSLLVLVGVSFFYSITFFRSSNPLPKLAYYLLMLPLIIGYFALVYKAFGIIDSETTEMVKPGWLDAIYFSVVTWTTLGYGDFRPTDDMKVWVMVEAIMGYVYMGLLVGKVLYVASSRGRADA